MCGVRNASWMEHYPFPKVLPGRVGIRRVILITMPRMIVQVIKSRRMRWAGHVARMGEERGCIGSWWGNRREGENWGDLDVDGWIILGWICRRWDVGL